MVNDRGRVYGGQSDDERRAERRERLLAAGLDLFGTSGWDGTGIERICSEAGVSTRYFYEEFKGREDLLEAVYAHVGDEAVHQVCLALRAEGTDRERVRGAVVTYVLHVTAEPGRVRLMHQDARRMPSLEPIRFRLIQQLWTELSRAWSRQDEDAPTSAAPVPGVGAQAISGAINEVMAHWLSTPEPRPAPALIADRLARTLTPALLAAGRAA